MPVLKLIDEFELTSLQRNAIFQQISDWEKISYGENRYRTAEELSLCVTKESSGFYVAFYKNELVGYIDIWQLTKSFYAGLRSSLIVEEDLSPAAIVTSTDQQTNLWYVGSMVIAESFSKSNNVKSGFLFKKLCACIPNHLSSKNFPISILGVGSSLFGQKILLRWGFDPIVADINAVDTPDRPRFEKHLQVYDGPNAYDLRKKNKYLI